MIFNFLSTQKTNNNMGLEKQIGESESDYKLRLNASARRKAYAPLQEHGESSLDYQLRLNLFEKTGIIVPKKGDNESSLDYQLRLRASELNDLV
jgi:hypothetical protein